MCSLLTKSIGIVSVSPFKDVVKQLIILWLSPSSAQLTFTNYYKSCKRKQRRKERTLIMTERQWMNDRDEKTFARQALMSHRRKPVRWRHRWRHPLLTSREFLRLRRRPPSWICNRFTRLDAATNRKELHYWKMNEIVRTSSNCTVNW